MGCGSSTTADPPASTGHNTAHNQRATNTNSNTNTNTNTNTAAKADALNPDDNAIYGCDLYEDDADKQKGEKADGGGEANENTDTVKNTGTNANEMQYDDAGFYGETDNEKNEVELFDGGEEAKGDDDAAKEEKGDDDAAKEEKGDDDAAKEEETNVTETDDTGVTENKEEMESTQQTMEETDVIPPTETEQETGGSEQQPNDEEGDVIAPTETEEETGKNEAEPEPTTEEGDVIAPTETEGEVGTSEPEPEPNTEEGDVIPPPTDDDIADANDGDMGAVVAMNVANDNVRPREWYAPTSTGPQAQFYDFRSTSDDDDWGGSRPSVEPGQLWEDLEFGLYEAITDRETTENLKWKRPSEISSSPVLFSEGSTRFDIGQGGAGTCWFLSTVANISESKELLNQVIPDDAYPNVGTEAHDGIFHARFWRFGVWDDVYIDDFLPVIHDTVPWGARSATDENEFWVSLLEKAFARYHGSYNAVYGGQPGDAYLALTGGVAERIDFEESDEKPRKLYSRIHNAINSGALVTCTVPDEYEGVYGLVGGHAYSLTGTAKARGVSLVRVRNPWGNTEWTGPWSDGSAEWDDVSESEVPRAVIDDGEFWISLQDFMIYFSQTTICSLTPDFDMDGSSDSLNYVTNVHGEWFGETAAGFKNKLKNPRFLFTVPESESEAAVVVQLIQRRKNRQVDNFQIRCDCFRVLGDNGESAVLEIMGENTNSYCPEAQCSFRHRVGAGTYAIVPSTVDAGFEKSFLIRVFSSCPVSDIREMPRNYKVMACKQQTWFSYGGQEYPLSFCKTESGAWRAGVNAGGQISNRDSHASNPQYVLTVSEATPVVLHVMQEQVEPRMPIGLRLFPTGNAPLSIDDIYDQYDQAVYDTESSQSKFVQSWDVEASYMLDPGQYTLLLHMDEPDTEKVFSLVVKASVPVDVRGYQTGV